ncbi:hypothetical protein L9F63_021228, partial [Diploptera punctata]
ATIACSELEKINNSSHGVNDDSPTASPSSSKSRATNVNTVAMAHPVALCSNVNNKKRCFSLVIQGPAETSGTHNFQQNRNIQQFQQRKLPEQPQMQRTEQIIVHSKEFLQPKSAEPGNQALYKHTALLLSAPRQKIPRPPNAFMLFANEWRKKLAVEFPRESNKDISVRLGAMWKTMLKEEKEKYFTLAREVDAEHKRKYPGYL